MSHRIDRLQRKTIAVIPIALCVAVLLYLAKPLSPYLRGEKDTSSNSAKVVMVTTSQSCHCALERCREVRECLHRLLAEVDSEVTLEVIDYAEDPDSAERIMQRFDVYMIPIVVLMDRNGQAVYKSEWDLDEDLLETKLKYDLE